LSQSIGDYALSGPSRTGRVGTWSVLTGPDGLPRGGLRLDTTRLDQAIADRLSAVVRATRALPGFQSLIDQVHDGKYLWLIADTPASPTLASLFGSGAALPPPVALLIAVDIGQSLSALHAAGLAHGDVGGDTVVLTADGRAVLTECGYAAALAGTTPGPGPDVTAWVALARSLAAASSHNALLLAAAAHAENAGGAAGLTAALDSLTGSASQVPGYGERSALAVVAAMVPIASAAAPPPPPAPSTSEAVTVRLEAVPAMSPSTSDTEATLSPDELATQLGKRNEDVLRFGRGVAAAHPPRQEQGGPTWRAPTAPYPIAKRPNRNRRRVISILSGALTVVILALVGYYIVQRLTPLQITGVAVGIAQPLGNSCDAQVDVVGTVTSNGGGGTFSYRWVRSDGAATGVFTESVSFGTEVTQVHLLWKFSGKGTLKAKATLQILTPQPSEASADFTYNCK
jgi:hypothetical protein